MTSLSAPTSLETCSELNCSWDTSHTCNQSSPTSALSTPWVIEHWPPQAVWAIRLVDPRRPRLLHVPGDVLTERDLHLAISAESEVPSYSLLSWCPCREVLDLSPRTWGGERPRTSRQGLRGSAGIRPSEISLDKRTVKVFSSFGSSWAGGGAAIWLRLAGKV